MMKYNPPWYCTVCLNNKNYKMTGKYRHLSTRLHQRNLNITKDFPKLENELIDEPKSSAEVPALSLNQTVTIGIRINTIIMKISFIIKT